MDRLIKNTLLLLLCLVILSCNRSKTGSGNSSLNDTLKITTPVNEDSLILSLSKQVLTAMKNRDYTKLASFFHPVLGVRFSPYGYIDTASNLRFTPREFLAGISKSDKLIWGAYDGSGDTIRLTVKDYFSKFVYNADFLNAEQTSLNKTLGRGNSLNNLEKVYRDCKYAESYFSGFDKKYGGMDWCSLRIVFKNYRGRFYVVGIVHDQWTI